jgi:hypothetical protein
MTQRHSPLYSARFEPRRIAQMALRGQLDIGFEPEVLLKLGWQAPDHLEFRGKPETNWPWKYMEIIWK